MSEARLLLLEDNDDDALLVEAALSRHAPGEFALTRVARLADALARIAAEHFDAVLSDLDLPDSRGIGTAQAIAERHPALALVVLTGFDDRELGRAGIRHGAQDYLVKGGADGAMIARTLRYAIERKHLETKLRAANDALEWRVTERTLALEGAIAQLRASETRFRELTELSSDWYWEQDEELRFTWFSNERLEESGADERVGKTPWELHHAQAGEAQWSEHRRQLEARLPFRNFEFRAADRDGRPRYASVSGLPVFGEDRSFRGYRGVGQDITARKLAELALARQKDLYAALSQTNQAIVRCGSREDLLPQVCRIAVEYGRFLFAWIGLIGKDDKRLKPTARYGEDGGYIDQLDLAGDRAVASRRGLTGRTLASGAYVISNDFANDPAMAPWHGQGRRAGVRAAAKFPLRQSGAVVGAINLYAAEPAYFTPDLIGTLEEMAADVSFALDNFERKDDLRRLNRALKTINACNEALIRSSEEAQLLDEICGLLVNEGGFSRALVAEYPGDTLSLRVLAQAGRDEGYTAAVSGSVDRSAPGGAHLSDTAFRTGKPVIVNDIANDPAFPRWREEALKRGFASHIVLPLVADKRPFGVLSLYADETGVFDEQEVKLLLELAADLAYGIVARRTRIERDQALRERQVHEDRLRKSLEDSIEVVAATVETRDAYTAGHQRRVAELAVAIASRLGLDAERLAGIRLGAIVHDLGKIHIPAEILSKPGRLSAIEFELMKTHPQSGYNILKGIEFPWPIARMVHEHHERLDGSGYPQGIKGEEIILEAKIMAVADVVEAMASHRPYRPGLGIDQALAEISAGRGKRYDPAVVDACVALFTQGAFAWPTQD
ncbi:MAG: GAF domain-containing protein [Betaproteobacteria bacterium]|nr:GAF domain-containing protein [Betaproteobacteria bacterium]